MYSTVCFFRVLFGLSMAWWRLILVGGGTGAEQIWAMGYPELGERMDPRKCFCCGVLAPRVDDVAKASAFVHARTPLPAPDPLPSLSSSPPSTTTKVYKNPNSSNTLNSRPKLRGSPLGRPYSYHYRHNTPVEDRTAVVGNTCPAVGVGLVVDNLAADIPTTENGYPAGRMAGSVRHKTRRPGGQEAGRQAVGRSFVVVVDLALALAWGCVRGERRKAEDLPACREGLSS